MLEVAPTNMEELDERETAVATPQAESSIKVLQINIDRGRAAHHLALATAVKWDIDLIMMGECNGKLAAAAGLRMDVNKDAAVGVVGRRARIDEDAVPGRGFIWLKANDINFCSCYISPNIPVGEFEDFLYELGISVRQKAGHILIAGDFNASSPEWGGVRVDRRGELLADWVSQLDLVILNVGDVPTFSRGDRKSRPDITLASTSMADRVKYWSVSLEESLSGHRYVTYEIIDAPIGAVSDSVRKVTAKDTAKIIEYLRERIGAENPRTMEEFMGHIKQACNAIPGKRRRKQVYWWNDEIAGLRKKCHRDRRIMTKWASKKRPNTEYERASAIYKGSKRALKRAIEKAKKIQWAKLIEEIDQDLWGCGYRIATKNLKLLAPPKLSVGRMKELARSLFPTHAKVRWEEEMVTEVPLFSMLEFEEARSKIRKNKAPGPDGICPEAAKEICDAFPELVLGLMNGIMTTGIYPKAWKKAKLVLIEKPKGSDQSVTKYRPICLLDTMGKIFEQLLAIRLKKIELSDRQYGFREGRSTVGAVKEVLKIAQYANQGTWRTRELCLLITLDIRNAFNSASWAKIMEKLEKKDCDPYLKRIIKSYFSERLLLLEGEMMEITSGVSQGSVIGPPLWNILFDEVLSLDLPIGVYSWAYADDKAIVVTARTESDLMQKADIAIAAVIQWLESNGLQIAPEKTEAVLLIGRRKVGEVRVNVAGHSITPSPALKYLGIWMQTNMSFTEHVKRTSEKAARVGTALSRIMPRVGGPSSNKRRLLASVTDSILLYGAPVWSKTMDIEHCKQKLMRVQRAMAIRTSRAYRTISGSAALVISGITPIDLLARERARIYEGDIGCKKEEREKTLRAWDKEWRAQGHGMWTRRMIPDIGSWIARKHGEVGYHTTQVLSGHGCFRSYLYVIKKAVTEQCFFCNFEPDTAEHAIFECPRWHKERAEIDIEVGSRVTPDNAVKIMLQSEEKWGAITKLWKKIMVARETIERMEQKEA